VRILSIFLIFLITAAAILLSAGPSVAREITLYNFEKDPQGWEIPDWALAKKDNVSKQLGVSEFHASEGKYALELDTAFSGLPNWEGAYVEKVVDVTDWSPFGFISVDIFLPATAPRGLRAKIILTVSDKWVWTEMNRSIPLTPGEWTVIKADLMPESMAWRRFIDESFRADVKKIGIRIESNGKVDYRGAIYIDNVKLTD
jgi:hypothetical protein